MMEKKKVLNHEERNEKPILAFFDQFDVSEFVSTTFSQKKVIEIVLVFYGLLHLLQTHRFSSVSCLEKMKISLIDMSQWIKTMEKTPVALDCDDLIRRLDEQIRVVQNKEEHLNE